MQIFLQIPVLSFTEELGNDKLPHKIININGHKQQKHHTSYMLNIVQHSKSTVQTTIIRGTYVQVTGCSHIFKVHNKNISSRDILDQLSNNTVYE